MADGTSLGNHYPMRFPTPKAEWVLYTGMAEFDRQAQFSDKFGRTGLRIASEQTAPMMASIGMPWITSERQDRPSNATTDGREYLCKVCPTRHPAVTASAFVYKRVLVPQ